MVTPFVPHTALEAVPKHLLPPDFAINCTFPLISTLKARHMGNMVLQPELQHYEHVSPFSVLCQRLQVLLLACHLYLVLQNTRNLRRPSENDCNRRQQH